MKMENQLKNVYPKVPGNFHNSVTDALNTIDNEEKIKIMKKPIRFTPIKVLAAAMATVLVMTLGVGAANGWSFANVFGGLFSNSEGGVLAHTIKPEVRASIHPTLGELPMSSNALGLDFEVLGIAGDNKSLYIVIEFIGEKAKALFNLDMWNFTPDSSGLPLVVEDEYGFYIDYSGGGPEILAETENSVKVAFSYEFTNLTLEKGWASFSYYEIKMYDESDENRNNPNRIPDDMIFFDVLIDYDFLSSVMFDVYEEVNMPVMIDDENGIYYAFEKYEFGEWTQTTPVLLGQVEISPLAVRFTSESLTGAHYDRLSSVRVKFNNGDVLYSGHDSIHGSGAEFYTIHFNTPFDLDDVYSVTIGDFELLL
jgi:hypothetical protein